ncbi:unnamed protein product [Prunus brigantina]
MKRTRRGTTEASSSRPDRQRPIALTRRQRAGPKITLRAYLLICHLHNKYRAFENIDVIEFMNANSRSMTITQG